MPRTIGNVPITLNVQTSAKPMYTAPQVNLVDVKGDAHRIDHLQLLQEAEKESTLPFVTRGLEFRPHCS